MHIRTTDPTYLSVVRVGETSVLVELHCHGTARDDEPVQVGTVKQKVWFLRGELQNVYERCDIDRSGHFEVFLDTE
jgi:hypothetical protein